MRSVWKISCCNEGSNVEWVQARSWGIDWSQHKFNIIGEASWSQCFSTNAFCAGGHESWF